MSGLRRISGLARSRAALRQVRPRQEQLDRESAGDAENQGDDDALEDAEAVLLDEQHDQDVERGDGDAQREGNAEEQVQRDGGPDHLGQVARRDSDFRQNQRRTAAGRE